jgi:hypothetical protein
VSSVPLSTAGPPWTEIPVVHGPVDPVYGNFFNEIKSLNQYFQEFAKKPLCFFVINPRSTNFSRSVQNPKIITKKVPSLRKIHKNSSKTSKIHIFPTTTPN